MNIDENNLDLLPPSVVNSIKAGNPQYTKPVEYTLSKSTTLPSLKTRIQQRKLPKVSLGNVGKVLSQTKPVRAQPPQVPTNDNYRANASTSTKYNSYADCVKGLSNAK